MLEGSKARRAACSPFDEVIGPVCWGRPRGVSPWESRVLGFFITLLRVTSHATGD